MIKEFGASTINIDVRFWVDTFQKELSISEIQSQVMKNVLKNLGDAGINLPGDIIEIKNYKDKAIQMGNVI